MKDGSNCNGCEYHRTVTLAFFDQIVDVTHQCVCPLCKNGKCQCGAIRDTRVRE